MPWDVDGYVASLTAASPHTREAYERDARQLVEWAERGELGPEDLDTRRCAATSRTSARSGWFDECELRGFDHPVGLYEVRRA